MLRLGTMTLGIYEMNKKTYNFTEINKLSGWKLAQLRK